MSKAMQVVSRVMRLDVALIAMTIVGAGLLGVLQADDRDDSHATISGDLEVLRSAFNANPDHVRAILLASPT